MPEVGEAEENLFALANARGTTAGWDWNFRIYRIGSSTEAGSEAMETTAANVEPSETTRPPSSGASPGESDNIGPGSSGSGNDGAGVVKEVDPDSFSHDTETFARIQREKKLKEKQQQEENKRQQQEEKKLKEKQLQEEKKQKAKEEEKARKEEEKRRKAEENGKKGKKR